MFDRETFETVEELIREYQAIGYKFAHLYASQRETSVTFETTSGHWESVTIYPGGDQMVLDSHGSCAAVNYDDIY